MQHAWAHDQPPLAMHIVGVVYNTSYLNGPHSKVQPSLGFLKSDNVTIVTILHIHL